MFVIWSRPRDGGGCAIIRSGFRTMLSAEKARSNILESDSELKGRVKLVIKMASKKTRLKTGLKSGSRTWGSKRGG